MRYRRSRRLRLLLRARHFAESCSDSICAGEGGIDMNEFCAKNSLRNLSVAKKRLCASTCTHTLFAGPRRTLGVFPNGNSLGEHTRRIRQIMAKKSSAKNFTSQLADDVLFGARVLYRELDDIFGHVSGRLPREAKREGLLFTPMRFTRLSYPRPAGSYKPFTPHL